MNTKQILLSLALATSLTAADYGKNFNLALKLARAQKAETTSDKIVSLHSYIGRYILDTADLTPTKTEINSKYGLSSANWNGYSSEMSFSVTNGIVTFTNTLPATSTDIVKNAFIKSGAFAKVMGLVDSGTLNVRIPFGADVLAFDRIVRTTSSNTKSIVSTTTPTNTTKTWFKPTGTGALEIYKYNPTSSVWDLLGATGDKNKLSSLGYKECLGTFSSLSDLSSVAAQDQGCAIVYEDSKLTKYFYIESEDTWVLDSGSGLAGGSSSSTFNGDSTIQEVSTTLFDKIGGSTAKVSALNGEFSGQKTFTKWENTSTGGYWATSDMKFIIVKDLTGLLTQNWEIGTTAYVANASNNALMMKMEAVSSIGNVFMYQAYGYDDVLNNFVDAQTSSTNGSVIHDTKSNIYFKRVDSDILTSIDETIYLSKGSTGRNSFPNVLSGVNYYTVVNDCDKDTCNGASVNNYYAGGLKDTLYLYTHTTNTTSKNNLTDAVVTTNLQDAFDNNYNAVTIGGVSYTKEIDINGNDVYKDSSGNFYTSSGTVIPSSFVVGGVLQLPAGVTAQTAEFDGDYLKVSSRSIATDWVNAPHGIGLKIGSKNYTHLTNNNKDFWTDDATGDGQQNAKEIFTRGSRSNLPNITHSLTALTAEIGSEDRYTTNGVKYPSDNSLNQWFYSSSSGVKKTNGLLDAPPCKGKACYNSISSSVTVAWIDGAMANREGSYWVKDGKYLNKNEYYSYWVEKKNVNKARWGSKWLNFGKPYGSQSNYVHSTHIKDLWKISYFDGMRFEQAEFECKDLGYNASAKWRLVTQDDIIHGFIYDNNFPSRTWLRDGRIYERPKGAIYWDDKEKGTYKDTPSAYSTRKSTNEKVGFHCVMDVSQF